MSEEIPVGSQCAFYVVNCTKKDRSSWVHGVVQGIQGDLYEILEKDDDICETHHVKREHIIPEDCNKDYEAGQRVLALFYDPYIEMWTSQYYPADILSNMPNGNVLLHYCGADVPTEVTKCKIMTIPDYIDPTLIKK